MEDLSVIRAELDRIDNGIVELYKERLKYVEKVAEYKIGTGKPVFDAEREKQKLDSLSALSDNEFDKEAIIQIFNQIMTISRKRQYQIIQANEIGNRYGTKVSNFDFSGAKVVYQGVEGAYSQAAMKQFFGKDVDGFAVETWKDAMESLRNGEADYAVLPIENSSQGIVAENHDLLAEYGYFIVGEQIISIDHALIGIKGSKIEDIKTVYSHPQAIMQCNGYISSHEGMESRTMKNTAMAAKFVKEQDDPSIAAIAGEINAELYDLEILDHSIQDRAGNMTRFVIVSPRREYEEKANKISCFFEIPHSKGSLYNSLSHLIFNNINLCRIESRPSPEAEWEYRFFVDFEGNLDDTNVRMALYGLGCETTKMEILGNYVSRG